MVNENKDMLQEQELEELFQASRDVAPMPGRALWERVLHDSTAHLPEAPMRAPEPARPALVFRRLFNALGGLSVAAGLTAATLAGLWIGYAHPGIVAHLGGTRPMAGMEAGAGGFELEDFEPGVDVFSVLLEDS